MADIMSAAGSLPVARPTGAAPVSRTLWQKALPALNRRVLLAASRLRYSRARFGEKCDIRPGLELRMGPAGQVRFGNNCVLDRSLVIECEGALQVGDNVIFGHHCTLAAQESIVIGENTLIAEMVSIRDHDHCFDQLEVPIRDQGVSSAPVHIGRNVWIAAKVTIVKGITIGDNAIIGANAVVTRDIPANAIAVGIPARVVRMRDNSDIPGEIGNGK